MLTLSSRYYVSKVDDSSQLPSWLFPPESRSTFQSTTRTRPQHAPALESTRSNTSIFSDVPTPSSRFARKLSDDVDSGYGSSSSFKSLKDGGPSRPGSRTSDKLRAMRRPQTVTDDHQPLVAQSETSGEDRRKPISQGMGLPARGAQRLRSAV
jgi:hypothetical protein